MPDITNSDDMIDIRDVIERVEELRTEQATDAAVGKELALLEGLLSELRGKGGGEQWQGDSYPFTLIRDGYFKTAMDELLERCGTLPRDPPHYLRITVDYDALRTDYSSVDFDGVTYWYH